VRERKKRARRMHLRLLLSSATKTLETEVDDDATVDDLRQEVAFRY